MDTGTAWSGGTVERHRPTAHSTADNEEGRTSPTTPPRADTAAEPALAPRRYGVDNMLTVTNRLDTQHRAAGGRAHEPHRSDLAGDSRPARLPEPSGRQQAVKRLTDRTPPETVEQARAKQTGVAASPARQLHPVSPGAQGRRRRHGAAVQQGAAAPIAERAELAGAYAPERAELDVNVTADPSALIAQTRDRLLAVLAEREQRQLPVTPTSKRR